MKEKAAPDWRCGRLTRVLGRQAEKIGVDKYSVDDLKKFNKNKKIIKKFSKK
jgi:hypothetical protein